MFSSSDEMSVSPSFGDPAAAVPMTDTILWLTWIIVAIIPSSKSQRLTGNVKVLRLLHVVTAALVDDDELDPSRGREDWGDVEVAVAARSGCDSDRDGIKSNERDGEDDRE